MLHRTKLSSNNAKNNEDSEKKAVDSSSPVSHRSPENPAIQPQAKLLTRSTHEAPLMHVWLVQSSISIRKHHSIVNTFKVFPYFPRYSIQSVKKRRATSPEEQSLLLKPNLTSFTVFTSIPRYAVAREIVGTIYTRCTISTWVVCAVIDIYNNNGK